MACIYWTRTVQYFGHRHFDMAHTYNELAPLLEITTALDPHLLPAYEFGASFLAPKPPNGAGEPVRAIQLMEYGIEHNPDNWRLYYDLGFVYYTELKDYRSAAAGVSERGSKVPNAHPFMKIMAAQMAMHAGDFATSRMLWSATYESSQEANIRQNAIEHLRAAGRRRCDQPAGTGHTVRHANGTAPQQHFRTRRSGTLAWHTC